MVSQSELTLALVAYDNALRDKTPTIGNRISAMRAAINVVLSGRNDKPPAPKIKAAP